MALYRGEIPQDQFDAAAMRAIDRVHVLEALATEAAQKLDEKNAEIASLKLQLAAVKNILHRAQNSIGASMGPNGSEDPTEALEAVEAILEGREET